MKFCEWLDTIEEAPADMPLPEVRSRMEKLAVEMPYDVYADARETVLVYGYEIAAHIAVRLLGDRVPVVDRLDSAILKQIALNGVWSFNMGSWEANERKSECGTAYCRAGWALHIADPKRAFWRAFGPEIGGAIIYLRNTGTIPNFYAMNEGALASMRKSAFEGN